MTLITNSADTDSTDVASVEFTSGIDGTYKLYIFKFIDINPATDGEDFEFNGSIDAGSNYNVTKTTTFFQAQHEESDATPELAYQATRDLAQGTGFQCLSMAPGNGSDESCAGTLWLFNPSNTTYVKHFYSRFSGYRSNSAAIDSFSAGYFNTTDNIDAVKFMIQSGNMDGTIKMYGVG